MTDTLSPGTQQVMQTSLERALDRLSSLETPSPAPKAAAPVIAEVEAAPPEPLVSEGGRQIPNVSSPPAELAAPPPPAASGPGAWGPQQQQALHQILQSNTAMEAELATLRAKAAEYEGALSDARAGDMGRFADKTQIDRATMLEALKGESAAPATLPYVRKLEAKLAAIEQQWQQRDAAETQRRELGDIASQLQSKTEYGILKQIPDAAARVQALIQHHVAAARDRGEVAPTLTVEQAARMLQGEVVATLKRFLSDDSVRKELGLGESVTPETVKAPRPKKAITSSMTSQGSTHKTTTGYDPDERLRLALRKVTGA